ncbi:MAG: hypothetical protein IJ710_04770 [Prevotella sp.]|nr:hypothetical protein [Prevotella sp.]
MMKQTMKWLSLLSLLLLGALTFTLTACGGDDDDDNGDTDTERYDWIREYKPDIDLVILDETFTVQRVYQYHFDYYSYVDEVVPDENGTLLGSSEMESWFNATTRFRWGQRVRSFEYTYDEAHDMYIFKWEDGTPPDYYRLKQIGDDGAIVCTWMTASGEVLDPQPEWANRWVWHWGRFGFQDSSWSGGGGGSSSSSYATCPLCSGSGKCRLCDGKGYIGSSTFSTTCRICKGTGKCSRCGGSGQIESSGGGSSSGGSSSGGDSGSSTYTYDPTTAIVILQTGSGSSATYSKSEKSMYKGTRKSDGNVYLFTSSKSLVGSASRNTDSERGGYRVSSKSYCTIDPGVGYKRYYYFD